MLRNTFSIANTVKIRVSALRVVRIIAVHIESVYKSGATMGPPCSNFTVITAARPSPAALRAVRGVAVCVESVYDGGSKKGTRSPH